ncbi:MAG: hypothetical protein ACRDRA_11780 [Pseudonocardiaceae bacterium]
MDNSGVELGDNKLLNSVEIDPGSRQIRPPGAVDEIRKSAEDVAAGRTVSIEEVQAEFGRSRD